MCDFIEIKNLSFGYDSSLFLKQSNLIFDSLSVKIPQNKITAIIGPNGSGKSTLLKNFCGFLIPHSGEIFFEEENLLKMNSELRAKKIAFVPQNRHTADSSVFRLVLSGRFPYTSKFGFSHQYKKQDYEIAEKILTTMGISDLRDKNIRNISGGQRQKVYIAMALAQTTPILVFDEPLSFLDIHQQLEFMELLLSLKNSEKKTLILVIHDLSMALKYSDNIIVLDNGKIAGNGSPQQILDSGIIQKVFNVNAELKEGIQFSL